MNDVILIDGGHGGTDRANQGPSGYIEADGNLDMALKARDYLLANYQGVDVIMTRETDDTVGVRERGKMASQAKALIALSFHSNAVGSGNAQKQATGPECYYSIDLLGTKPWFVEMSRELTLVAQKYADQLGQNRIITNRGAKIYKSARYPGEDYLGFIDEAQDGGVPVVGLIEFLFHDNPLDEAILKLENARRDFAIVVANAIAARLELKPKALVPKDEANNPTGTTAPQWKIEGEQYLFDNGYIEQRHDPLEVLDIGTLGAILMNRDESFAKTLDIHVDKITTLVDRGLKVNVKLGREV